MNQIDDVYDAFEFLDDWEQRYQLILDLGKELPDFPDDLKIPSHKVEGCVSQVWMICQIGDDQCVSLHATSDSLIVRGLIAILVMLYHGKSLDEARGIDVGGVFTRLGLDQHLSPNRRNGFAAMTQRIYASLFE